MECWFCRHPKAAIAVCKTCGRGVCRSHAHENPNTGIIYCEKHKVPE